MHSEEAALSRFMWCRTQDNSCKSHLTLLSVRWPNLKIECDLLKTKCDFNACVAFPLWLKCAMRLFSALFRNSSHINIILDLKLVISTWWKWYDNCTKLLYETRLIVFFYHYIILCNNILLKNIGFLALLSVKKTIKPSLWMTQSVSVPEAFHIFNEAPLIEAGAWAAWSWQS